MRPDKAMTHGVSQLDSKLCTRDTSSCSHNGSHILSQSLCELHVRSAVDGGVKRKSRATISQSSGRDQVTKCAHTASCQLWTCSFACMKDCVRQHHRIVDGRPKSRDGQSNTMRS